MATTDWVGTHLRSLPRAKSKGRPRRRNCTPSGCGRISATPRSQGVALGYGIAPRWGAAPHPERVQLPNRRLPNNKPRNIEIPRIVFVVNFVVNFVESIRLGRDASPRRPQKKPLRLCAFARTLLTKNQERRTKNHERRTTNQERRTHHPPLRTTSRFTLS